MCSDWLTQAVDDIAAQEAGGAEHGGGDSTRGGAAALPPRDHGRMELPVLLLQRRRTAHT